MTEAQWLVCEDPRAMLRSARGPVSYRKLRLLIGGSCRLRWYELAGDDVKKIVTSVEALADSEIDGAEFLASQRDLGPHSLRFGVSAALRIMAWGVYWGSPNRVQEKYSERLRTRSPQAWEPGEWAEVQTLRILEGFAEAAGLECATIDGPEAEYSEEFRAGVKGEVGAQARLLREILGNPFRPVTLSPDWRTDTALTLARVMYEDREFGAMPILADALQDAGCDSDDILNHCRGPGPHVRGCWVVDLVLDKE